MDAELPPDLVTYLRELDEFIEREIRPLEERDDNLRFFDYRREHARTDWDRGGIPRRVWEDLLRQARDLADAAGHYRYLLPAQYGGGDGTNLGMAVIREHLAHRGLGLHCDLQSEHAIVGNHVAAQLLLDHGTDIQKQRWLDGLLTGRRSFAFAITEPDHGSDATHMETRAIRRGEHWMINGEKTWNSGVHTADADLVFGRTSGDAGDAHGITAFLIPMDTPGLTVERYLWTFNMPTDHAHVMLRDVRVGADVILGKEGRGLDLLQRFVNANRIRQAAASLGAAQYCIDEAVRHAGQRVVFGGRLSANQAIQFPLAELHTQCEMLRALLHKTARLMDTDGAFSQSSRVSMCNYWANRLCCLAADTAMQVHGGLGYSREVPFEHIYRHHRRYRLTEGTDEIQLRRIAGSLFKFMEAAAPKGVDPT